MIDVTASTRPHRRRIAVTLLATGAVVATPAPAQSAAPPPAARTPPAPLAEPADDEIVVTGKPLPGAVIGDIPPENQLSPRDIAGYGVGTVSELLDQIAEQTRSDQGRDSGGGPVVLVNGKRISGINEVGDLPAEAILRVDILPEEVALKYGYDAQSKVVNIILKRRVRSQVVNLGGGLATEGQGGNADGDVTVTRIHDNDRLNIAARASGAASLRESDRDLTSARGGDAIDPTGAIAGDGAFRTLKPSTRNYALNATLAHQLGSKVNASFNARGSYATSHALDGLAAGTLAIPAISPFAIGTEDATLDRTLSGFALGQRIETASAHAGATVNADLSSKWKLSVVGGYDHGDTRTGTDRGYDTAALQAAITAGDPAANPYGALSPALLGPLRRERATAQTDSGNASALVTGPLFKLPAGPVQTSLRIGGDFNSLRAATRFAGGDARTDSDRTNGTARLSFDLPIASRRSGFLSALGNLTANLNGAVTQVSDYGTLGTFGYGLNWTPRAGVSLIASVNEDRVAPSLTQLDAPLVTTSNVRVFDFVTGRSVLVTQRAGGNPDLKADDRHVLKLGVTLKPFADSDFTLTANYIDSRTRNAIGLLISATALTEAAFPQRYVRDEDGMLTSVDSRSVNFAREDREEMRWGITFTRTLRAPKRPVRPPGGWRRGEGAPPWAGRDGGSRRNGGASVTGPPAPDSAAGDIVVEGRREADAGPPPPPGDGGPPPGPPPDGFGPPPGGGDFGPPGGGPAGGGFGGRGGGFGGRGGRGFSGGSDNGARLQFSLFHSWFFRDSVLLADGGPRIDLLDGGTLGGAGQPRHQVQLNTGLIDNGVGLRLSGSWQSATRIAADGGSSSGELRFSSLATFDLRLFANLQNRFPGKGWARGTRVSLAVSNLFDRRQRVRDPNGDTPLVYQPAYLDPFGRTVSVSIRKIF